MVGDRQVRRLMKLIQSEETLASSRMDNSGPCSAGSRSGERRRGRLRILIHPGADGEARFYVYQRKEYQGALEFLKA